MRWMTGAVLALMVSGCGGGQSDDFTVSIQRSPDAVLRGLAQIDVTGPSALVSKPVSRTLSDGGVIEYTLPAADGYDDGIIRFTVTGDSNNRTNIAVMVDVPAVEGYVDGGPKVIAEDKVEDVLESDLQSWARNFESGNGGEFANLGLEASIVTIAAVLQNFDDAGMMASGNATMFDAGASDGDWESSEQDLAYGGTPMSDPGDDASDYGQPMDDAAGDDTDGGWGD